MLQGIIRFGDETAKEVMTPRQDIVDIDISSTFNEVLSAIVENNYSRMPVFQGNTDNIRGVLYIKDLLPHLEKGANFRWQSLIRPPYFVPETKKIDDLLREFQENKVHMAIVVDEFGGTSGLITLEDILEEIVGEINDEYDEEEKMYSRLAPNVYVFEGKTLLSDFQFERTQPALLDSRRAPHRSRVVVRFERTFRLLLLQYPRERRPPHLQNQGGGGCSGREPHIAAVVERKIAFHHGLGGFVSSCHQGIFFYDAFQLALTLVEGGHEVRIAVGGQHNLMRSLGRTHPYTVQGCIRAVDH